MNNPIASNKAPSKEGDSWKTLHGWHSWAWSKSLIKGQGESANCSYCRLVMILFNQHSIRKDIRKGMHILLYMYTLYW